MDAIVTAGGIPQPGDPLYEYSNGDSKALIDVAGKPMVQWILNALGESKKIENVIVIGLTAKSNVTCKKPLHFISNQGRMLANIVAGVQKAMEINPKNERVLIVSSDIPALRGDMVDWLVNQVLETDDEIYYGVCPREVMEARYPNSKRTYTKLKDMQVCGADINAIHVNQVTQHLDTWEQLIGNRKSPLKQAGVIGFDTLIQLAFRRITLQELVERACSRIGVKGRAIIWDRAEPCMDVDKPHQLELMRTDLEAQKPQKKVRAVKRSSEEKEKPAKTAKPKKAKSE